MNRRDLIAPGADAQAAVEAFELRKAYGTTRALDGLSLAIGRGTVTALLGPNGAGKTTFMETICGMRAPDSGSVRVLGLDPVRRRRDLALVLGVQVQEFSLQATVKAGSRLPFSPLSTRIRCPWMRLCVGSGSWRRPMFGFPVCRVGRSVGSASLAP